MVGLLSVEEGREGSVESLLETLFRRHGFAVNRPRSHSGTTLASKQQRSKIEQMIVLTAHSFPER
jgi:hypothetical protein